MGLTVAWLTLVPFAQPALAQSVIAISEPGTEVANDDREAGNEIVVTATRRAERLYDIPATITAVRTDDQIHLGTSTLDQIAESTPGFFISKIGDTRPRLFIRGVGTRDYDPGSVSSVGVFIDDLYIGHLSGVLSSLEDVERVEIIKGPQTTLYGRNTIGGAINVVTKAPTGEVTAEAKAGLGNFGTYELFGMISGPLYPRVRGRIMAYRARSDGYFTNLTTGRHSQGYENWGGRARLLFEPSAAIRISLIADLLQGSGPSVNAKNRGSPTDPDGTFFSGTTFGIGGAGKPELVADRFADFYNRDALVRRNAASFIAKTEYDAPGATVTSISTYRSSRMFETRDFDASSLDAVAQSIRERSQQFTQELRLTSTEDGPHRGGAFRWIAGLFYYHDRTDRSDRFDFGQASISALRTGAPQSDIFTGNFASHSWAVFAEGTLDIDDHVSLTAGIRGTEDRRRLVQTDIASRPGAAFIGANFTSPIIWRNDQAWTPKAIFAFAPSENLRAYASYNRGYKGGGFQYIPTTLAAARTTFRPETTDAYELGFRARRSDRKASLDVTAFYYDSRDLQVQRSTTLQNGSIAIVTSNADKSRVQGVEAAATIIPSSGLNIGIAYSLVDGKYVRYRGDVSPPPGAPSTDFSGTPLIRSPKHTVAISAEYAIPIRPRETLTPRVEWSYRSEVFFEPGGGKPEFGAAIPMTRQGGYDLLNVGLDYSRGHFHISAAARNLLGTYFLSDVQKLPFNYILTFPGSPRTVEVQARYEF